MSFTSSPAAQHNSRFSYEAFEPLNRGDATIDIPLEPVGNGAAGSASTLMMEKERPQSMGGVRRAMARERTKGYDGEEDAINKMGILYNKLLNTSLIVRYFVYIIPLGILLAIPMIVGATVGQAATIGDVRIVWLFAWLLIVWVGLWGSKLVAHYLPNVFQYLCGIVSPETRKYALVLKHLEIQLSLAGAALVALSTFKPIMTRNPDTRADIAAVKAAGGTATYPYWETVVERILAAAMCATLIWLGERTFIQLISVNYHRKQFSAKIRESKEQIRLLALMYDASRALFPAFCHEFAEEDAIISDTLDLTFAKRKSKKGHARSGSNTPLRLLRDVGRFGDKLTTAFGNVAHEITGKDVFNPTSATSIVVQALERNRSAEALAKRIWLSFVIEGNDALYIDDVNEVLGTDRHADADACFSMLDLDGNADVTMAEMITTVTQMGRDRKSINKSMHDVDQAINVLDKMLCVVIFVVVIFVFVAFLNTSFVTTLATAGTALLSLSFVFSVTAQEILGSCIFLFVKHPFDIGDRVDLSLGNDQLIVEHISLLFTVFRRVTNHRTLQIPNIVLNTLWIENVSRSRAMREQITLPIHFDTTSEDVQLLRTELSKFVQDKDNSRDFLPDVEVEVQSVGNLDKLDLIVQLQHKSNWSNETVRAARRSKFMCALVLALRKVPIYGPGAGKPALGEEGNPRYSVTITDTAAAEAKTKAAKAYEGKRMIPTSSSPASSPVAEKQSSMHALNTNAMSINTSQDPKSPLSPITESAAESQALTTLNERSPALDTARDDGTERLETASSTTPRHGTESKEVEEVRGILKRVATQGRRRRGDSLGQHQSQGQASGVSLSSAPPQNLMHTQSATTSIPNGIEHAPSAGYALNNAYSAPPSIPPVAAASGNGFFGLGREASLRAQAQAQAQAQGPSQHYAQPPPSRSPARPSQPFQTPPQNLLQQQSSQPWLHQQTPQYQQQLQALPQHPPPARSRSQSPISQRSYEPSNRSMSRQQQAYAPLVGQEDNSRLATTTADDFGADYDGRGYDEDVDVPANAGTELSAGSWRRGV